MTVDAPSGGAEGRGRLATDADGFLLRRGRHTDAYVPSELAPSGEAGGLTALTPQLGHDVAPDVSDCLVTRYRPWLLTIWEPLLTKAPCPAVARPHCCYVDTVIFYDAGHRLELHRGGSRWRDGVFRRHERPGFVEFGRVQTRMGCDAAVRFEGETFVVSPGRVIWASHGRDRRRWWMRHGARRQESRR